MGKMQRAKGQRGEREFLTLLSEELLKLGVDIELTRNLQQTRQGGADCLSLPGFAIEVKRSKNSQIPTWWAQAVRQAESVGAVPVLAWRRNRASWTVYLHHEVVGLPKRATGRNRHLIPLTLCEFAAIAADILTQSADSGSV